MTDQTPKNEVQQLHSLEPFPEPNTYPKGWDIDAILTPQKGKKPPAEPMPDWYEHFDEPNTTPPGWDF